MLSFEQGRQTMFLTEPAKMPQCLFAFAVALSCSIATLSGTIAMITLHSPFA